METVQLPRVPSSLAYCPLPRSPFPDTPYWFDPQKVNVQHSPDKELASHLDCFLLVLVGEEVRGVVYM
jgi:hypothetical protein